MEREVARVYCIAVRRPKEQLGKLFSHAKIDIHPGELGAKQLGLSDRTVKVIFDEADVVIHAGADVSFMKRYQSLKPSNVSTTKELVRLCLPRRIPLHFVSSAAIARLSRQEIVGPISLKDFPPSITEDDGYVIAKWVSEVYLELVSQQTGLPVTIHRPSSITGEDAPKLDLISNLTEYVRKMKTVPDMRSWSGFLDFVSVQSAANMIVTSISEGFGDDEKNIRFLHEVGEKVISLRDLKKIMEAEMKERLDVLPTMAWADQAAEAGMDRILVSYVRRALGRAIRMPRLAK